MGAAHQIGIRLGWKPGRGVLEFFAGGACSCFHSAVKMLEGE